MKEVFGLWMRLVPKEKSCQNRIFLKKLKGKIPSNDSLKVENERRNVLQVIK